MYLEAIGRQMAVCSLDGAVRLTGMDKGYWNVVSIHGPKERKALLPLAKTIHYSCFDDIEDGHRLLSGVRKRRTSLAYSASSALLDSGRPPGR